MATKGGTVRALLLACALATVAATRAGAEPAPGTPQQHVVKPGDTLWDISRQHFGRPLGWPAIGQRNAITEPRLLQPGRVLNLDGSPNSAPRGAGRTAHAPAASKATANRPVQVLAATGDVQWAVPRPSGGHGARQPALAGMVLPAGAVIRTGPDSFVTLGLPDGSRSTLPSQSEVRVARVPGDKGRPAALLELTAGEVEARVPPRAAPALPGEQTFRVRTRMATVGVRGTHFRVALAPWATAPDGIAVGVQEGRVWVRGAGAAGDTELNAGQGLSLDTTSPGGSTQALLPAPEWLDAGRAQQQPAVTIAWNAVPGAAGYRVQLARDPGFLDVFAEQRVATDAGGGLALFDGVPAGSWFARAAALSPQGLEGAMAMTSFARLQATLRGSASMLADGEGIEFRWSALPGALYELQVADDARFERIVLAAPGLKAEGARIRTLPPGQYWWRVRGTSWSQGQQSQVESAARPLLVEGAR